MFATSISKLIVTVRGTCLIIGILFMIFAVIRGYSHPLEVEVYTPEMESMFDRAKDRENQKAYERMQDGKPKPGDEDKAREYVKDNFS